MRRVIDPDMVLKQIDFHLSMFAQAPDSGTIVMQTLEKAFILFRNIIKTSIVEEEK